MPGDTMNAPQNDTPILRAEHFTKYLTGRKILDDCSISMRPGDVKVLIGPSGAGKSTFLQCINCLLEPDQGEIWLGDRKVDFKNTRELYDLRQHVGMIFQEFNLFDHLTAEENVSIALRKVMGCNKAEARNRALTELSRVGLAKRAALYPAQLSGGQKQRVAIARALAKNPKLLLCDEPTGALDYVTGKQILKLLQDTCRQKGVTVVVITHNSAITPMADRVIHIKNGTVESMQCNEHPTSVELIEW